MNTSFYYLGAARKELQRNFWSYLKATLLYYGISAVCSILVGLCSIGSPLLSFLLSLVSSFCIFVPLQYAWTNSYLDCLRQTDASPAKQMISIFRNEYVRSVLLCILFIIIAIPCIIIGALPIVFLAKSTICLILYSLFVISLFVIFALAISQTTFLVHENPTEGIGACLSKSIKLMKGHKFQLFRLLLLLFGLILTSFILYLPGIQFISHKMYLPAGIFFLCSLAIFLYLTNFAQLALTAFYKDLVDEHTEAKEEVLKDEGNTL